LFWLSVDSCQLLGFSGFKDIQIRKSLQIKKENLQRDGNSPSFGGVNSEIFSFRIRGG